MIVTLCVECMAQQKRLYIANDHVLLWSVKPAEEGIGNGLIARSDTTMLNKAIMHVNKKINVYSVSSM